MNETVASDDDDGEPFAFTETFVAAVVGVCGVLVFCLPLNKLIRWCCLAAGDPKRGVAAENGDAEKDMWDRLDGVYAAAVAEKIPTAIKRLAGSVCIYVAVRMASRHHVSKDYDWIVEDATMVLFPLFFGLLFLLAWVDVFGKYFEKRSRKTRTLLDDQILSFGTNAAKTALVVLAGTHFAFASDERACGGDAAYCAGRATSAGAGALHGGDGEQKLQLMPMMTPIDRPLDAASFALSLAHTPPPTPPGALVLRGYTWWRWSAARSRASLGASCSPMAAASPTCASRSASTRTRASSLQAECRSMMRPHCRRPA